MASSFWHSISLCSGIIYTIAPASVLDIGLNSAGRWGAIIRDFSEVWHHERVQPEQWQVQLDAIEAYEPNINAIHKLYYNNIYCGNAVDLIDGLGNYDLIFLGDVIEHFEKPVAMQLLEKCAARARYVLINTPGGKLEHWEQGAAYGNPYEQHRCIINKKDLLRNAHWNLLLSKKFRVTHGRQYWTYLLSAVERDKKKFSKLL